MNIKMLFTQEETISKPLIEIIKNVLKEQKLSSYSIYKNIKKDYPEQKCCYKDIDILCREMLSKKYGNNLSKEGRYPCVYFINSINITQPIVDKKRKIKNNIIFDEKSYITPENRNNEKFNTNDFDDNSVDSLDSNNIFSSRLKISNYNRIIPSFNEFMSNDYSSINKQREESLKDILNYQYEKFLESKDIKILDNIAEIKKIKYNI